MELFPVMAQFCTGFGRALFVSAHFVGRQFTAVFANISLILDNISSILPDLGVVFSQFLTVPLQFTVGR